MTQTSENSGQSETVQVMSDDGIEIGKILINVSEEYEGIALVWAYDQDGGMAWLPFDAAELDELIAAAQRVRARLA